MERSDRLRGCSELVPGAASGAGACGSVPLSLLGAGVVGGVSFVGEVGAVVVSSVLAPSGAVIASIVVSEDCDCGAAMAGGRTMVSGVGGEVGSCVSCFASAK